MPGADWGDLFTKIKMNTNNWRIFAMPSLLWFIAFLLLLGVELVLPGGFYSACLALGNLAAGPAPAEAPHGRSLS